MTRDQLVERLAQAIAHYEGYYITREQAMIRGISFPTRAQHAENPGNLRRWADKHGKPYPTRGGYVDFVAAARERYPGISREATIQAARELGWKALRKQIERYIEGKLTGGKSPTLREMIHRWAPASDGNNPEKYTEFVASFAGIPPDKPLIELCAG